MRHALFFLVVAAVACSPVPQATQPVKVSPAGNVHFGVEQVSPGVMRLMLDNGAPHQIGYNLCASVLERRTDGGWTQGATDICTMQLLTLNPGADATFEKRPGTLAPGEYRYVTRIESPLNSAPVTIATPPFSIR